jgi:hypothetical protein
MVRALILAAAASATLLAGCGSTHSQSDVQRVPQTVVQGLAESPSPQLACIARQSPTGATREESGSLAVRWPDGEVLLVKATASAAAARAALRNLSAARSAHGAHVRARIYGTTVVQWRPKAPSAAERAVLHGCLS